MHQFFYTAICFGAKANSLYGDEKSPVRIHHCHFATSRSEMRNSMKQSYILLEDKLNKEYKEVFERIDIYGNTHFIDSDVQSGKMMELLDSMLEAQNDGQSVSVIVGNDIDKFCKEFYSDYTVENRIREVPERLFKLAAFLLIVELIDFIIGLTDGEGILRNTDLSPYFIGIAGGIIVDTIVFLLIRPLIDRFKKIKPFFWNLCMALMVIIMVMFLIFIPTDDKFTMNIKSIVPIVVTTAYILIYLIFRIIINYRKYGTFKIRTKKKEKAEISFRDAINEGMNLENELPREWLKGYKKKYDKAVKKGKTPVNEAQYLENISKKCDVIRVTKQNTCIFVGMTVILISGMWIAGQFESVSDGLIYSGLMCVIEGGLLRFFNKSAKETDRIYKNMIIEMQEKNITLEEYVESLK